MATRYKTKDEARQAVWDTLEAEGLARFPFPPHGRIPNFKGAEAAAERLLGESPWKRARYLKINPDAPQRPLRLKALQQGTVVFVPTPRLKGGFKRFDPAKIPEDKLREAASLSKGDRWAEAVDLRDLPPMDGIVAGSVAVTRTGRRAGKGEGYSDLEYAILRELGHDPVPVATTVHDCQVVGALPREATDLPLSLIVTPAQVIRVAEPPPAPEGLDWDRLTEADINEMPVLKELRGQD